MISTYHLKSRFQALLRPLAGTLHRYGVTANQVTVAACLVSVALGIALAAAALVSGDTPGRAVRALLVLVAFWCLLRMAANALDGMLARDYGQASPLGAVLNEAGDIVSDVALYLPFALLTPGRGWPVAAVVALAVCGEAAAWAGARRHGTRANHGPMGKSDRALVFGVTALLLGCGAPITSYLSALWVAVIVLSCLTLYHRARHLLRYRATQSAARATRVIFPPP